MLRNVKNDYYITLLQNNKLKNICELSLFNWGKYFLPPWTANGCDVRNTLREAALQTLLSHANMLAVDQRTIKCYNKLFHCILWYNWKWFV